MLLTRISWLQDKKSGAQELASRTTTMRRGTYGEQGGPRVADSLFTVARMLEAGAEEVLAARLLNEIIASSGDATGMRTHLVRDLWFLANVEAKIDDDKVQSEEPKQDDSEDNKVAGLRKRAREVRDAYVEREWPDEDSDEGFMRLVSWMLW